MCDVCVWAAGLSNVEWNLALKGLSAKEHTALQVQTTVDSNTANSSSTDEESRHIMRLEGECSDAYLLTEMSIQKQQLDVSALSNCRYSLIQTCLYVTLFVKNCNLIMNSTSAVVGLHFKYNVSMQ